VPSLLLPFAQQGSELVQIMPAFLGDFVFRLPHFFDDLILPFHVQVLNSRLL
jgi:hypothetical protein